MLQYAHVCTDAGMCDPLGGPASRFCPCPRHHRAARHPVRRFPRRPCAGALRRGAVFVGGGGGRGWPAVAGARRRGGTARRGGGAGRADLIVIQDGHCVNGFFFSRPCGCPILHLFPFFLVSCLCRVCVCVRCSRWGSGSCRRAVQAATFPSRARLGSRSGSPAACLRERMDHHCWAPVSRGRATEPRTACHPRHDPPPPPPPVYGGGCTHTNSSTYPPSGAAQPATHV